MTRPSAYSQFTTVSTATALATAIANPATQYLYLPYTGSDYQLANPILISRTTPLVFHCQSEQAVNISAVTPTQPLLAQGSLVQFR